MSEAKLAFWILLFLIPYINLFCLGICAMTISAWFLLWFAIGIALFGVGFVFIENRSSDYLLAAGGLITLGIVSAFFLYSLWALVLLPLI